MSLEVLYIFFRLLHFCAVILLFGITVFVSYLSYGKFRLSLQYDLHRLLTYSLLIALLTSTGLLSIQSGLMGDGWSDTIKIDVLADVLSTTFGQAWRWQIIFTLTATICLFLPIYWRFNLISLLAFLLLISLGFVGHATLHSGSIGWLHRINHALHLICGGYWLGALIPLLVCLRYLSVELYRSDAIHTLIRFSRIGHLAVILVVLTGIINSALILQRWPVDWSSDYQQLLGIKVILVIVMIMIALYNRYRLVPKMNQQGSHTIRYFSFCTGMEILLGIIVLSLVSLFATLPPT
ncbi:copper homeostasis membrane protein CopD [Budviciaceae bacterium BWR-B9]|uniref:Copper resistance protein D n=1 Tax=Limnobaculum allomyrinae TaxID=2791986 RepID=A0ABS1IMA9_9GAMM|nr:MULTISPECIES: copper homeostasis membrane protein CopD [Limnobaculum]MBK5142862.1 copper homeostasis membrane protein CopD [Limnobaculum allomyrinae]MBV7690251.1 copper homeostasis membrane protein CopD [Limnobaculum sp. M2-1]